MNYPQESVRLQPASSHVKTSLIEEDEISLDELFVDSESGKEFESDRAADLQKSLSTWNSISELETNEGRKIRRIAGGRKKNRGDERSLDTMSMSIEMSIEELPEEDESDGLKDDCSTGSNSIDRAVATWFSMSSADSSGDCKLRVPADGKPTLSTEDLILVEASIEEDYSGQATPVMPRVSPRKAKSTSDWLDLPSLDKKRGVRRGVSDLGHGDLSRFRSPSKNVGMRPPSTLQEARRGLAKRGESVRGLGIEQQVIKPSPLRKFQSPEKQRRSLAKRGQSVRTLTTAAVPGTEQDMRKAMASRGLSVRRLNSNDSLPMVSGVKRSGSGDSSGFERRIARNTSVDSSQAVVTRVYAPVKLMAIPQETSPTTTSPNRAVSRKVSPNSTGSLSPSRGRSRCTSNESLNTNTSMIPSLEPLEEDKELDVQHDDLIQSPMLRLKTGSKFQLSIPIPQIDFDDGETMEIEQVLNAPPLTRKASRSPNVSPHQTPKRAVRSTLDQVSPPHVETSFTKRNEKIESSDLEWVPPGASALPKLPEIDEVVAETEEERESASLTPKRSNQKNLRKMISSSFLRRKQSDDGSELEGSDIFRKTKSPKGSLSSLRLFNKSLSCRNADLQVANCYGPGDSRFGASVTAYSDDSSNWNVSNTTPKYKKPSEIQLNGSTSANPRNAAMADIMVPPIPLEQAYRNCRSRSPKRTEIKKVNSVAVMTGPRQEFTISPMVGGRSISTTQIISPNLPASTMEPKATISRKLSFRRRSMGSINTCNAVSEDLYNPTKPSNTAMKRTSPCRWQTSPTEAAKATKVGERRGVLARLNSSLSHLRYGEDEDPTEIDDEESNQEEKKQAPQRVASAARILAAPTLRRVQSAVYVGQRTANTSVLAEKQQERKNLLARMRSKRNASGDDKTAEMMSTDEFTPKKGKYEFMIEPDSPLRSQADIPTVICLDPQHAIEVSSTVTSYFEDNQQIIVQSKHERAGKPKKRISKKLTKQELPKEENWENLNDKQGDVELAELFQSYTSFSYTESEDVVKEISPIKQTPTRPFEFSDDEESFFGTGSRPRSTTPLSRVKKLQANNLKYRSKLIIDLDSDDDESLGFDIVDDTTIGNKDIYMSDEGNHTISDASYDIEVVNRLERAKKARKPKRAKRGGKRRGQLIEV